MKAASTAGPTSQRILVGILYFCAAFRETRPFVPQSRLLFFGGTGVTRFILVFVRVRSTEKIFDREHHWFFAK